MKRPRLSVRGKLLLAMALSVVASLVLAGVAMALYDLRQYRQALARDLGVQAEVLGVAAAPALIFDDPGTARRYLELFAATPEVTRAAIYLSSGALFAAWPEGREAALPPRVPADGHRYDRDTLTLSRPIVAAGDAAGTLLLTAEPESAGRLWSLLTLLAIVLPLSLMSAALIIELPRRAVARPVAAVTDLARRVVEERDHRLRVEKSPADEMGRLVDAVNELLGHLGSRISALEAAVDRRPRIERGVRGADDNFKSRDATRATEPETGRAELEGLIRAVSHDLRAPLRAIGGFSRLLREDHAEHLDADACRKLDVICDQAGVMAGMIDALVAFARLGRTPMNPVELDMGALAREVFGRLRNDAPDALRLRLDFLPPAHADPELMEQVWRDLLSNAIKFTSHRESPRIEVGAVREATDNVYYVRDNGAGFDPDYVHRLFGLFQRLHDGGAFPGTGAGLARVRRIVDRHGGRTWAEGSPDGAATFYFSLPRGDG